MSINDSIPSAMPNGDAPFYVVHGTIAQGGAQGGASTPKIYTPFHVSLSESPDLDERVRVAHEVLGLVIDAGNSLSQLMAVSHETEGLSSLLDSLLGGAEYARDVLVDDQ
ncbi:MAG: hypothetical protein RKO24_07370 [Candidatus Competibacter sp.]|nr:hypothetical protein [Candidatus Competibacter sp.]